MSSKFKYIISLVLIIITIFAIPVLAALRGDIDSDGKISAGDARLVLRASVGLEDIAIELGDIDNDGKISAGDARLVLRASVGLEDLNQYDVVDVKPEVKWENSKLGLKFATNDFDVYQGTEINTLVDISLFESIDMSAEMMAIDTTGTKTITVISGTNSIFSSTLMTSALKMMVSSSEDMKLLESGKQKIADKTFNLVSIKMNVGDEMSICDYYVAEINKTLVMICITYPENAPQTRTEILSCFNK